MDLCGCVRRPRCHSWRGSNRWCTRSCDEGRKTSKHRRRKPCARKQEARDHSMNERSDARAPLSVLVPVKNEAANLRDCLASASFAQEIVVVDSGSTDGTQAVAEAAGARIVQFVWSGKFPRKKNWALQNVRWQHEWVLILDADERI